MEVTDMSKASSTSVVMQTSLLLPSTLLHLLPCLAVLLLLKWSTRSLLALLWHHTAHFYWSPDDIQTDFLPYRSKPSPPPLYKSLPVSSYGVLISRRRDDNASCRGLMHDAAECCSVCLAEMRDRDEVRELLCDHVFHRTCLDSWVEHGHATCPLCRGALASAAALPQRGMEDGSTTEAVSTSADGGYETSELDTPEDGEIGASQLMYLACLTGRWVG